MQSREDPSQAVDNYATAQFRTMCLEAFLKFSIQVFSFPAHCIVFLIYLNRQCFAECWVDNIAICVVAHTLLEAASVVNYYYCCLFFFFFKLTQSDVLQAAAAAAIAALTFKNRKNQEAVIREGSSDDGAVK